MTAKLAEGHLSQTFWAQTKEIGLNVEINWYDAESPAEGLRSSFSNDRESRVMLCAGHVGGAYEKNLNEVKRMSSFSSAFIVFYKSELPTIHSVKCWCAGKKRTFAAMKKNL